MEILKPSQSLCLANESFLANNSIQTAGPDREKAIYSPTF